MIKMPVKKGKDSKGPYFSWGTHGCRYHFKRNNRRSESIARSKAARQGRAIKANS